jgi:hydrogen cyanide synthase HcnB
MKEIELVITGGGPAGISAAIEAASRGVKTVLIDENNHLGGKVLREKGQIDSDIFLNELEKGTRDELFSGFDRVKKSVTVVLNSVVWGIFHGKTVALHVKDNGTDKIDHFRARKIIIPVGAFDRPIPFPGWTLPGVFSTGGLNSFCKHYGALPGKVFLVAGSGPLQLVLTDTLLRAGAKVAGVVEAASLKGLASQAFGLLAGGKVLKLGIGYLLKIKRNRIPVYHSHIVSRASGDNAVHSATIVKVDKNWRPIKGTEKEFGVDTLAVGYGLCPSIELAASGGCRVRFDDRHGHWRIEHDERMETSVPGIFVAGDGVDVKGYLGAIEQGKIAGIEAAAQLGYLPRVEADELIRRRRPALKKMERYGRALNTLSVPRKDMLDIITDDTIICRCEEVTFGDIRLAVAEGARDSNHVKRKTRLGMGYCQGRYCGQVINELISRLTESPMERGHFTFRVPVKPIPIGAFLDQ